MDDGSTKLPLFKENVPQILVEDIIGWPSTNYNVFVLVQSFFGHYMTEFERICIALPWFPHESPLMPLCTQTLGFHQIQAFYCRSTPVVYQLLVNYNVDQGMVFLIIIF
jgi:hypothetical protein